MSHCTSHSFGYRKQTEESVCKNCGTTISQWNAIARFGYENGKTPKEREWLWCHRFALEAKH